MCQFKSAILLKDRVYVPDHDSHSDMLKELNLPDDMRHATETFVRVECIPANGDKLSDPMTWTVKVDQDIRPEWYIPEVDDVRVREAVREWRDAHMLRDGEHEVKDGVWFAYGSATVEACDSAKVRASGSAKVEAYGSATVEACDSATVRASGSATVEACGSATVWAHDSAKVEASGSATVRAHDSAKVEASGSATVRASGSATVWAHDSAKVEAYGSATVEACGSATVWASGSATVEAYGSATVRAYGSATVWASGSATVILPKNWATSQLVDLHCNAVCIDYKRQVVTTAKGWTHKEHD